MHIHMCVLEQTETADRLALTLHRLQDELKPITCKGQSRDLEHPSNYARNDVNGNYAVTHLDVLSTLPIMRDRKEFRKAIDRALKDTNFDQDVKVQVFEVTIRVLGSLLSSYQQLVDMEIQEILAHLETPTHKRDDSIWKWLRLNQRPFEVNTTTVLPIPAERRRMITQSHMAKPSPRAQKLLALALDLADRLIPAFNTPTGLPWARVNLKHGVEPKEDPSTCAAAAGSLLLEFTLLSRLSGDPKFEAAARRAFLAVWDRRSSLNLIGNSINVMTGHWYPPGQSGIGAGIDSLYEYALKSAVMMDDDEMMDIWDDLYAAVMQNHRSPDGYFFRNVHVTVGTPLGHLVDSLSAFWPGLQVLAGDVENAIRSHLYYWKLWEKHSAIPEAFNYINKTAEWNGYPLRPEAIESTYYLYQATRDDFYLEVGERMLKDLSRRTKTHCGFAVIHDVFSGRREDRMESFMLSETLKYLYLLFDADNAVNKADSGTVFTTEGHRLRVPTALRPKHSPKSLQNRKNEFANSSYQCVAYRPYNDRGLYVGVKRRPDYDYVATLVDMPLIKDEGYWSHDAVCQLPSRLPHHFEIMLGKDEMPSAGSNNIRREWGNIYVDDVRGVKGRVTHNLQKDSFYLTSVDGFRTRPGQQVIIRDPLVTGQMQARPVEESMSLVDADDHPAQVIIRIAATSSTDTLVDDILETTASTAVFGRKMIPVGPSNPITHPDQPIMGLNQEWVPVQKPIVDDMGCPTAIYPPKQADFIALVKRGGCTFFEKLATAKRHGAIGVVVYGGEADLGLIRPSADGEPVIEVEDVGMVYVPFETGKNIAERLDEGESVSLAFEALEYESVNIMDMDSVLNLLDYDHEDLKGFLGEINLGDLGADVQRLEGMLSRSTSALKNEIKAWKEAVELEAKVFQVMEEEMVDSTASSPPPLPPPASVTVLGRPVANLLIMPPS
ncbi:hypothetical protein QFC22_004054 [Naganishia vaughanmartiniae]|uniref:Uncharacterized protein n=1 Tax=Naganishia vaughanmartiniae TaxID=1424756 RepID=A0ACC2X512_9TREE|nr:hypothetical protein QFC22_004054 [Naganishia vaughanmartiniae]